MSVPDGHTYLCRRKAAKARFDNRHSTSAPAPTLAPHQRQRRRDNFAPHGASALFVSDGDSFAPRRELLLSAVTKVAKSTA